MDLKHLNQIIITNHTNCSTVGATYGWSMYMYDNILVKSQLLFLYFISCSYILKCPKLQTFKFVFENCKQKFT